MEFKHNRVKLVK